MNTITLTNEQLNVVATGLGELPFKVAQPVFAAIQQQLAAASAKAVAVEPAAVEPAASEEAH